MSARQGYRFLAPVLMADADCARPSLTERERRHRGRDSATLVRAIAAAALVVLSTTLIHFPSAPDVPRNQEHHAAAAALVRTIHAAVFGPTAGQRPHHAIARAMARTAHDLIF
jgi:hypothetical protein